jgi:DNA-binding PadR family transcriptional regulator
VPAALSTTSYALLGLLVFDAETSRHGLTGYELKRRADRTLRFYWVSPAMSQIYTELARLGGLGLVESRPDAASDGPPDGDTAPAWPDEGSPAGTTDAPRGRRYRITQTGRAALLDWLHDSQAEFPVLKHPVALRLLMGQLLDPRAVVDLLNGYLDRLARQRADLETVRRRLGDNPDVRHPAMVADWGLAYYDSEAEIVRGLMDRVKADTRDPPD